IVCPSVVTGPSKIVWLSPSTRRLTETGAAAAAGAAIPKTGRNTACVPRDRPRPPPAPRPAHGRLPRLSLQSPADGPPSSRGLGRRPLTAETGVRIPVAVLANPAPPAGVRLSGAAQ